MDDEALMRELDKLEDLNEDLYLDDVTIGASNRGSKFSKRRGGRGFLRGKSSRGRGAHKEDIFDITSLDAANYDKWDLDHSDENNKDYDVNREGCDSVGGNFHAKGGVLKRQSKLTYRGRGGKHPAGFGGRGFDNRMSDMFDIESKPHHDDDRNERNSSWNRESRDSPGMRIRGDNANSSDKQSPRFPQRADPRLVGKTEYDSRFGLYKRNDPRLAQRSETSSSEHKLGQSRTVSRVQQSHHGRDAPQSELYDAGIRESRVTSQQVDKGHKSNVSNAKDKTEHDILVPFVPTKIDLEGPPKVSDHVRRFENRFLPVNDDPRLSNKHYNSRNSEKTIFEKIGSAPVLLENQIPGIGDAKPSDSKRAPQPTRRGPRSPSPISPSSPYNKKDRSGSPISSRKRDLKHSPVRSSNRGSRWDRSPSPAHCRGDRSISPRRRKRKDRSMSRERQRERSHDWREWSGSPHRKSSRRDRSSSPRRRRRSRSSRSTSRDRSRDHSYGRSPDRRRDRSLSHHSISPRQRHMSGSRDLDHEEHWKPTVIAEHQPPLVQPPPNLPVGGQPSYPVQPPTGYEMHPPGMYSEPYRQPPPPNYGPPPPPQGGPPPPNYGVPYQPQHYHYDNYGYPQPPYPEYLAPPPGPVPPGTWGTDRSLVYPDLSQPPPLSQPPVVQPPPPTVAPPVVPPPPQVDVKAEEAKKEAIQNEVLQQKQTLSKQREDYIRKSTIISRELLLLRNQEEELTAEKSRDNDRILRENHKLQLEIQNKLKAINNVIDMLTGIIGDKKEMDEKRAKGELKLDKKQPKTPPETPPKSSSESPVPSELKLPEPPVPGDGADPLPAPLSSPTLHGGSGTPTTMAGAAPVPSDDKKPVFNYVHYDPEMHWCRVCDVFPRTAKEFLNHLHSAEHKDVTLERKLVDMPWHKVQTEEEVGYTKGAPTKRTPIRGLQFFISATAWYCKLCDTWIGDLHCASLHLKSKMHTEKYVNFTEQNPHWETDWLADREKAYERKSDERRQLRDTQPEAASSQSNSALAVTKPAVSDKEEKSKKNKKECKKERKGKEEKDSKKKKRKKKGKKKGRTSSGSDSSSSSSSCNSSEEGSDGEEDRSKSIRVAMRNKFKSLGNQPLEKQPSLDQALKETGGWQKVELKDDLERLEKERIYKEEQERYEKEQREQAEYERLEKERTNREKLEREREVKFRRLPSKEDKMLREWMDSNKEQVSEGEKQILSSIKDRVKLKQEEERIKKRDERDRYYEKGYYDEAYRRRRRADSPDGRGGKRRSRTPEDRRWDRSRNDKYKRSPQRTTSGSSRGREVRGESHERRTEGDKKNSAKHVEVTEQDEAETKFEKQAAEAAARLKKKDKKPLATNVPKSKLPFIGRMPIMKHLARKKGDDENDKNICSRDQKTEVESPKRPVIGPTLPPDMIFPELSTKPSMQPEEQGVGAVVQDMDIDDEDSNGGTETVMEEQVPVSVATRPSVAVEEHPSLYSDIDVSGESEGQPMDAPPGVDEQPPNVEEDPLAIVETTADPHSKKSEGDAPLPQDFQDALNILFGDKKPPEASKPVEGSEPTSEQDWSQDMMLPGPHQMPGYGPVVGIHPMYPNIGPQVMAGSPGYHQINPDMPLSMMGSQDMSPHGMMGLDRPPPHGMMGPQDIPPHVIGSGPQDRPPHGMMGPQDMSPHGMMGPGPQDRPPHGMMGPGPQDRPPHGMMGPGPQDRPPHGMMGPQDMPPHGMMGSGPQERPPHGMISPQDMPPHGMMGHPDMPPHGMMGHPDMPPHGMMGPQDMPPHGMMGPQDRPPHGMMGSQDRPHGMMGPGPPDRPPHGMMGPGSQDRPPHAMMGPGQDRPPHLMMGPGPHDRPPHSVMGPGLQDMPPHSMMGPQDRPPHGLMGPQDRPPHGMMGPQDRPPHGMMGPQDRPPHGMMGPQDRPHGMMGRHDGRVGHQDVPLHLLGPDMPRLPPPPPPPKPANSDSEHSDEEGDKMNRRVWGDDDLAMLGMDAQDMAAQNF